MSLYKITTRENEGAKALMDSIVELNWHRAAALEAGWRVTFSVHEDTGDVNVSLERSEWPDPLAEAEVAS